MPLPEFRRILDFVRSRLTPLAPGEFLERMRLGTLPRRATLLTFDDCLHDTVIRALPEFTARGLTGCFFACPGLIDAQRTVPSVELMWMCAQAQPPETRMAAYRRLWPELLRRPSREHAAWLAGVREELGAARSLPRAWRPASWNLLAALEEYGMLVGNHTMWHSTVTADGEAQFERDAGQAYEALERRLGRRRRVFCYPYGRRADQVQGTEEALRRLGTEFAFVTQGGIASPRRGGCLNLHREDASYSAEATKLAPLLAFLR
jgi:peptidoglycan/xylan/chitin deacetylase (PgdA/CDA1 family)